LLETEMEKKGECQKKCIGLFFSSNKRHMSFFSLEKDSTFPHSLEKRHRVFFPERKKDIAFFSREKKRHSIFFQREKKT